MESPMVEQSDDAETLLTQAICGCKHSLRQLYARYHNRMVTMVKQRFRLDDESTEDIVAEAFEDAKLSQRRIAIESSYIRRVLGLSSK